MINLYAIRAWCRDATVEEAEAIAPQGDLQRGLIREKQQALGLAALLIGHVQGFDHQVRVRLHRQCPAQNSTRVEIHEDGQVMLFSLCVYVSNVATSDLIGRENIELLIQNILNVWSL